jgi:plastocyanin
MNRSWLLLAILAVPSIAACSDTSKAASEVAVDVDVDDFKFSSPDVRVPLGGSVMWTNNDSQAHTATSAGTFDAGTIEPGKTASVVFGVAGTFTYICSFHPFMTGLVTVG